MAAATSSTMTSPKSSSPSSMGIVQIGFGCVGGAYGEAYQSAGFPVYGIEANMKLVQQHRAKFNMFHVDDDLSIIKPVSLIMLSINTPLVGNKLNLDYLFSSVRNVAVLMRNNPRAQVVIRSTVDPGTTIRYKAELEKVTGFHVDVMFQPEYLRAATAVEDALNPWLIVVGRDEKTDTTEITKLYSKFVSPKHIRYVSIATAEFQKLAHNTFNATKISFFNQFYLMGKKLNEKGMDIDMQAVADIMLHTCEGLLNPQYGTDMGVAYDGFCLPKDSQAAAYLEDEMDLVAPFFAAVVKVNQKVKKQNPTVRTAGPHQMSCFELKKLADVISDKIAAKEAAQAAAAKASSPKSLASSPKPVASATKPVASSPKSLSSSPKPAATQPATFAHSPKTLPSSPKPVSVGSQTSSVQPGSV